MARFIPPATLHRIYETSPWNCADAFADESECVEDMFGNDWANSFRAEREREAQMFHPLALVLGMGLLVIAVILTW